MIDVALAKINSLPSSAMQADFVPPSEEAVFILNSRQLQEVISQAVQKAFDPLVDRVSFLEERIDHLEEENAALRLKLASTEKQQDHLSDNQFSQLQLIHKLKEESHTGPSQGVLERVARIEKLCQDAPGHIISLPELKGRLGIDKAVLSRLLKRINQDKFYLRQSKTDKRIRYLCLRPEMR